MYKMNSDNTKVMLYMVSCRVGGASGKGMNQTDLE